jgi:deaminated glutathione amidase
MSWNMKFAAVQLNSQDTVDANLSAARVQVERAVSLGAQVILLPEGFAFLGAETAKAAVAEDLGGPEPGPIASSLASWSLKWGVTIIGGGMPVKSPDPMRPYNTSVVFTRGELVAQYSKVHLFDVELKDGTVLRESAGNAAGDEVVVQDLEGMRTGLAICYDLRFPAFFALQREHGAEVLTLPAAFTRTTGQAHWHTLLRARAIETQCYVVAAGQAGEHPLGRKTFGHSMIIDPWGEVVAELPEAPGVICADLDPARVQSIREQMPVWTHRRALRMRP